jgi:NADH-quinone oxidoreductase subunit M
MIAAGFPWLSLAVFLPLAGALAILVLDRDRPDAAWLAALATSLAELAVAVVIALGFRVADASFQMVESLRWAPSLGLSYKLGLDGISLPMVLLTAVLVPVAVAVSRGTPRPKAFFALILALETAMIGTFVALDLILFYVFWEAVLVPMYFLIGGWGSAERRRAAMTFFLYTLTASVVMLGGLLAAGIAAGSFDYTIVSRAPLATGVQVILFWTLLAGLAVKIPIVPLHTWLPLAHVEAPTAGSVLLAGVLLKMGAYGMLRFMLPLAPGPMRAAAWWLAGLGVVSVVWGALMALAQSDLKRLVAYSSISHMGFVVIGVALATRASLNAAMFTMVSHGLISAMLFVGVGALYERTHTRQISKISGIARTMPTFAGLWFFASLAALGLPGLSGFVGEIVVLGQLWARAGLWALVPAAAMVLSAAYLLWTYQRIGMGEPLKGQGALAEIAPRELSALAPLAAGILALGVAPALLVRLTDAAARALIVLAGRAG